MGGTLQVGVLLHYHPPHPHPWGSSSKCPMPERQLGLGYRATAHINLPPNPLAQVSAILGSLEVKAFWSNTNITCM